MTTFESHGSGTSGGKHSGRRARVAVIGSGIAGLSAAYFLGRRQQVSCYERHPSAGLAFHGIVPSPQEGRIDVPLRVFTEGHYRSLLALYEELGVATSRIPYSCSFSAAGPAGEVAETFLRYGVGVEHSADEHAAVMPEGKGLLRVHAGFVGRALDDMRQGQLGGRSLSKYVADTATSRRYARRFLYPAFAGIATCSLRAAEDAPANVALEMLLSGVSTMGLRRVTGGAARAAERFLERIEHFVPSTRVQRVEQRGERVAVTELGGRTQLFDHVVVATPAAAAREIVALTRPELRALDSVRYERVRVVVHGDGRLLPPEGERGAFNFVVDEVRRATSATIWVNALQTDLARPSFQTINPILEPDPTTVLSDQAHERAVVSAHDGDVGARVARLNRDPSRRVWFCGSYAARGVPLLESGVQSARQVADGIDSIEAQRMQESA